MIIFRPNKDDLGEFLILGAIKMCGIWAFSILWFYFAFMNISIEKMPKLEGGIALGMVALGGNNSIVYGNSNPHHRFHREMTFASTPSFPFLSLSLIHI